MWLNFNWLVVRKVWDGEQWHFYSQNDNTDDWKVFLPSREPQQQLSDWNKMIKQVTCQYSVRWGTDTDRSTTDSTIRSLHSTVWPGELSPSLAVIYYCKFPQTSHRFNTVLSSPKEWNIVTPGVRCIGYLTLGRGFLLERNLSWPQK